MSTLSPTGGAWSTSLLRAILRPCPKYTTQIRASSKVTLLDKLHRKQKADERQKRLDSHIRAAKMAAAAEPLTTSTPTSTASSGVSSANSSNTRSPCPYSIGRTLSRQLPIYNLSKSGGNKHLTRIRKISGDLNQAKEDIRAALGIAEFSTDMQGRKRENVTINWTTKGILVRGWRRPELVQWAEQRGF